MNKKEIIKQLEKIQSLMLAEIFYVDDDVLDYKIRYRDDDIESYYNNDDMYNGITKAIKLLKGGK